MSPSLWRPSSSPSHKKYINTTYERVQKGKFTKVLFMIDIHCLWQPLQIITWAKSIIEKKWKYIKVPKEKKCSLYWTNKSMLHHLFLTVKTTQNWVSLVQDTQSIIKEKRVSKVCPGDAIITKISAIYVKRKYIGYILILPRE